MFPKCGTLLTYGNAEVIKILRSSVFGNFTPDNAGRRRRGTSGKTTGVAVGTGVVLLVSFVVVLVAVDEEEVAVLEDLFTFDAATLLVDVLEVFGLVAAGAFATGTYR